MISRFLPESVVNAILDERIGKDTMGWTTLAGGSNILTSLGNRSKQLEAYISHVYKCVNAIKDRVQSIPWKLIYRKGRDDAIVETHCPTPFRRSRSPWS